MGLRNFLIKLLGGQPKEAAVAPGVDGYGGSIMTPQPTNDQYFVRNKITFSKKLKKDEKITLKWEYKPDVMRRDMIEEILPACGCTADIAWGDIGIQAVFTHMEKPENFTMAEEAFTKTMTVYFKDQYGKVPDGRGGMMYDPRKKREVLSFTGTLIRP